jgi:hypothetical protein
MKKARKQIEMKSAFSFEKKSSLLLSIVKWSEKNEESEKTNREKERFFL